MEARRLLIITMMISILGLGSPLAYAEDSGSKSSDWDFSTAIYLWAMGLNGNVTVQGETAEIDVNFIDIIEESDSVFALQLHGEAWWRERWGGFLDGTYVKLGIDNIVIPVPVPPLPGGAGVVADLTVEMGLVEFGGLYRAGRWAYRQGQGDRGWTLDLLAGGRYTSIKQTLQPTFPPLPVTVQADESWTDPIIGGRGTFDLSERWKFILRTDIGGFGVGSDFTFNAVGIFDYRFVGWGLDMDILAGYRGLYQDYSSGSGPTAFAWDIWMHGPTFAWNIRW